MKYKYSIETWTDGRDTRMGEPQPLDWDDKTFGNREQMGKVLSGRLKQLSQLLRPGYYYKVKIEVIEDENKSTLL